MPGLFEGLYAEPARLKQFLEAMTGLSRGANLAIARNFPWASYRTYVDVGTAQGDLAAQVALANPHLTGQGFDLRGGRPDLHRVRRGLGLSGRLTFAPAASSPIRCRRRTSC